MTYSPNYLGVGLLFTQHLYLFWGVCSTKTHREIPLSLACMHSFCSLLSPFLGLCSLSSRFARPASQRQINSHTHTYPLRGLLSSSFYYSPLSPLIELCGWKQYSSAFLIPSARITTWKDCACCLFTCWLCSPDPVQDGGSLSGSPLPSACTAVWDRDSASKYLWNGCLRNCLPNSTVSYGAGTGS